MTLEFGERRNRKNFEVFGELGDYRVSGICASRSTEHELYFPDLLFTHIKTNQVIHIHPGRVLTSVMKINPLTEQLQLRGIVTCNCPDKHLIGLF